MLKNIFINSMTFNGKTYTKNYLDHKNLLKGGKINIEMPLQPNISRGIKADDKPYPFSVDKEGIAVCLPLQ